MSKTDSHEPCYEDNAASCARVITTKSAVAWKQPIVRRCLQYLYLALVMTLFTLRRVRNCRRYYYYYYLSCTATMAIPGAVISAVRWFSHRRRLL